MTFSERLKEAFANRAAEAIAASVTVLLGWVAYQIAPVFLPAAESALSKRVLIALLVTSLCLNVVVVLAVLLFRKHEEALRLRYGVYWDKQKNPYCPSCQKPLSAYANYSYMGQGYLCKSCNKVHALTDASGNKMEPARVLGEL